MGREVIPSTAAIQFPLAAIHPRSCNTPARFDSKRSTDLCVRTRSDPWGRCSFPCCRNVGERFVCPYPIHTDPSIDDSTLSLRRRRLPWCVHKRAKYHKLGRKALFTRVSIRETRCEVATRKKNGGRGEGEVAVSREIQRNMEKVRGREMEKERKTKTKTKEKWGEK